MSDSDIQRLEQRIAALESRLGASAQFQSPGGGSSPGGSGSGASSPATPAEWIAGAIAQAFPQGVPTQGAQGGANAQLFGLSADSVLWCTSRFVCATMSCGGSGWC